MNSELRTWRVQYAYATYAGVETVVGTDLEPDEVLARAKRQFFRRFGPRLAMAYESWRILP